MGDLGSIPGSGRFPWRRKWQPTPVFLLGESYGRRSLVGYSPLRRKESKMTEQCHFHFPLSLHTRFSLTFGRAVHPPIPFPPSTISWGSSRLRPAHCTESASAKVTSDHPPFNPAFPCFVNLAASATCHHPAPRILLRWYPGLSCSVLAAIIEVSSQATLLSPKRPSRGKSEVLNLNSNSATSLLGRQPWKNDGSE